MSYWKQASVIGCLFVAMSTFAQDSMRPEVATSLQSAIELSKDGKYEEAISRLNKTRSIEDLNKAERTALEKVTVGMILRSNDQARALTSLQYLVDAENVSQNEKIRYLEAMVVIDQKLKDYKSIVALATQYQALGGTKENVRVARYTALSELGQDQEVLALLKPAIEKNRQEGTPNNLRDLKLYAIAQRKGGDDAGYEKTLQELIKLEPKPEYGTELITRWQRQPAWSKFQIELIRLKRRIDSDSMTEYDYVNYAEEAMKLGLPAEAENALKQGGAKGLLGKSVNGEDLKNLADRVKKAANEDSRTFSNVLKDAKTGANFEQIGEVYFSRGQWEQAQAAFNKAFELKGVRRQNISLLHLGEAQCHAGEIDSAQESFAKVSPKDDPIGQIAGLWAMYCSK